jgi:hypothetical protein
VNLLTNWFQLLFCRHEDRLTKCISCCFRACSDGRG